MGPVRRGMKAYSSQMQEAEKSDSSMIKTLGVTFRTKPRQRRVSESPDADRCALAHGVHAFANGEHFAWMRGI